jgi:hypothetical protein
MKFPLRPSAPHPYRPLLLSAPLFPLRPLHPVRSSVPSTVLCPLNSPLSALQLPVLCTLRCLLYGPLLLYGLCPLYGYLFPLRGMFFFLLFREMMLFRCSAKHPLRNGLFHGTAKTRERPHSCFANSKGHFMQHVSSETLLINHPIIKLHFEGTRYLLF